VITGLAGLLDSLLYIAVSERTEAADSDGLVSVGLGRVCEA
jgi:hypothetical protein